MLCKKIRLAKEQFARLGGWRISIDKTLPNGDVVLRFERPDSPRVEAQRERPCNDLDLKTK